MPRTRRRPGRPDGSRSSAVPFVNVARARDAARGPRGTDPRVSLRGSVPGGALGRSAGRLDEGVVEGGHRPTVALLGDGERGPGVVDPLQRAAGGVERRRTDRHDAARAHLTSGIELVADGAARVDRVEDRLVAVGDGGPPLVVVAADVDEVGVVGEGLAEGGAVGVVPGLLQLLERVSRRDGGMVSTVVVMPSPPPSARGGARW